MSATEWTTLVVAAISALGAVVLQGLQMYLSCKRDMVISSKVDTVAKVTNGLTSKIVTAELTAERVVTKAEIAAKALLATAARTASDLEKGEGP